MIEIAAWTIGLYLAWMLARGSRLAVEPHMDAAEAAWMITLWLPFLVRIIRLGWVWDHWGE